MPGLWSGVRRYDGSRIALRRQVVLLFPCGSRTAPRAEPPQRPTFHRGVRTPTLHLQQGLTDAVTATVAKDLRALRTADDEWVQRHVRSEAPNDDTARVPVGQMQWDLAR